MVCHKCSQPAIGICKFCGRAICAECMVEKPFIFTIYVGRNNVPKAIVVADALWCGTCRPYPEPIPMPEIY